MTEPKFDPYVWRQATAEQAVERPDGQIRATTHSERGRPATPVPPIHAVQPATGRTACGRRWSPRFIWGDWPPAERGDTCAACLRALRRT